MPIGLKFIKINVTMRTVVHALQDILSGVNVIDVCVNVVSGLGMMMSLPKYLSILSSTSITPAAARDDNNNMLLRMFSLRDPKT